nr:MAG TPA: hypothetical protein [Bacteriophage sp.]
MASSFRFKMISMHKAINEIAMASQLFISALLAFLVEISDRILDDSAICKEFLA